MPQTLGGSLFVRNAIKFGYCMIEALESVYEVCDELAVVECGSEDDTATLLKYWVEGKGKEKPIKVVYNHPWAVANDWSRLAILANVARSMLSTDWHFMIQADEVLHEESFPTIRRLINTFGAGHFCRRLNLFRSPDTYVRIDLDPKVKGKPCGDVVCRLARREFPVVGDAESIGVPDPGRENIDNIRIFHYGYVREGSRHIAKAIDMQSWFFGQGSQPDQRIVAMRDKDNVFRPEVYFGPEDVAPIPVPHPKFSQALAARLRV